MKIQAKDIYHGSALLQIVEHKSFKALNKRDDKYGHYLVNTNIWLLIKHGNGREETSPWQYTFNADDLSIIKNDIKLGNSVYVCLLCGLETICVLNIEQFSVVVDIDSKKQQWVKVECPGKKCSLHVRGENGGLKRTIPHNAFPDIIFPS